MAAKPEQRKGKNQPKLRLEWIDPAELDARAPSR